MLFDDFYTTYCPYVRRVILAMVGNSSPDQVEDLIQDVFVRAWKAYERTDPRALHAWIARIAHNVAIDSLRARHVRQRHLSAWDDQRAGQIPDPGSAARLALCEELDLVKQVLTCMGPNDRNVLMLISQGYKTREIAASLELDYSRCKQRVMRARARFRQCYLALCG